MAQASSQKSKIAILYGTQTDTAKAAAEELGREAAKRNIIPIISEMDEFPVMQLPVTPYVIFVVATTGEGEPPQTMINTWKFLLRSDLPPNSLKRVKFTVFGLGDSSYAMFNAMAKKMTARMLQLGAQLFHKVGLGDAQHDFGYEGEFDSWTAEMWKYLRGQLPNSDPFSTVVPDSYGNKPIEVYKVTKPQFSMNSGSFMKPGSSQSGLPKFPAPHGALNNEPIICNLTGNDKLTSEGHWQDTRMISFEFPSKHQYSPGDIIMIQPENDPALVQGMLDFFSLKPDQQLLIEHGDTSVVSKASLLEFPTYPITAKELFTSWLALAEPPSRFFCSQLAEFTDSPYDEKLLHFASKSADGKSEYFSYCQRERRNILEVLLDFKIHSNLPLGLLIQGCGKQRAREYSISSAFNPNMGSTAKLDLTVAITEFETPFKRKIVGVCSNFLRNAIPNQTQLCFWIKKGTMTFPKNVPLIMVGPGTGVAAFRSVIQDRANTDQQLMLFFGCRSKKDDFYYQAEWPLYKNLEVVTAFSQERPEDGKVYVQHRINPNQGTATRGQDMDGPVQQKIKEFMHNGGIIYVSGRAKLMPTAVEKAFNAILGEGSVDALRKSGRYQQEVW